jgi:hypothetical protein
MCFYWYHQFYGPSQSSVHSDPDIPILKSKDAFTRDNSVQNKLDTEPVRCKATEDDDDKDKWKDVVFPPDKIPIEIINNKSTWYQTYKNYKKSELDFSKMHFIHVPKCGGSTMSSMMRHIMCLKDPAANAECCTAGACHKHNPCKAISGCFDHYPNRLTPLLTF